MAGVGVYGVPCEIIVATLFAASTSIALANAGSESACVSIPIKSGPSIFCVNTFMDDLLGARLSQQIGQVFPGFGDMYERSSHAMAWDNVRNSNPAYASLPAYGTKEFSSTLRAAAAKIPGFDEMQFTDAKGKP